MAYLRHVYLLIRIIMLTWDTETEWTSLARARGMHPPAPTHSGVEKTEARLRGYVVVQRVALASSTTHLDSLGMTLATSKAVGVTTVTPSSGLFLYNARVRS